MEDPADKQGQSNALDVGTHPRRPRTSLIGAFSLLIVFGWAVVFVYAIHAALPLNPIKLPLEKSIAPHVWLPEGWKFFTRSPREDVISAFVRAPDGHWTSALNGPNASSSNLFGIKRATRAQGIELGILQVAVSRLPWSTCKEELEFCVEDAPLVPVAIHNVTPEPTLCGEVGLVLQPPVPWAWSHSRKKITMPSKAIRINVKC